MQSTLTRTTRPRLILWDFISLNRLIKYILDALLLRTLVFRTLTSRTMSTKAWPTRIFIASTLALTLGCNSSSKPSHSLEVAIQGLYTASLSKTSDYAVIGSVQHGGSLWKVATDERLYDWNHSHNYLSTLINSSISADNLWSVTADQNTLVLWDIKQGDSKRFWHSTGEVLDLAINETGTQALLGLADNSAVLFDVVAGGIKQTFQHKDAVRSVDIMR